MHQRNILTITNDTILTLNKTFVNFDANKLSININENVGFRVKLAFSLNRVNWSNPTEIDLSVSIAENMVNHTLIANTQFDAMIHDLFVSIHFEMIVPDQQDHNNTLHVAFEDHTKYIVVESIMYDNEILDYKSVTEYDVVNTLPKWNMYNNQQLPIQRWLKQNESMAQMYGHFCVYFKSNVTETVDTLSTNYAREIVSVRKIPILFPNNELPQDRNQITEWDYPINDEVIIHVVTGIFENAFGTLPQIGDFLYVPIVNKLFKVNSVQSKVGFMGKVGWWEVFLGKYEIDEQTTMSNDLFQQFENDNLMGELAEMLDETVLSEDVILESTIDEKKEATENFTNKLVDSNTYLDVKETEYQREFINKRLEIVSINPASNAFPVSMYDCTTIPKNAVALTYNLKEAVKVNKRSLIMQNEFSFTFDFVTLRKNSCMIAEIGHLTIEMKGLNIILFDSGTQQRHVVMFELAIEEYYQISVTQNKKGYSVVICMLRNGAKKVVFQELYIVQPSNRIISFTENVLCGGNFYIGENTFKIDNNTIIHDKINPVLEMMNF